MDDIINKIIRINNNLFDKNPTIKKINVGFTNTIYNIDNKFIIKICTNLKNENNFLKEINFYITNHNSELIPKLYNYSTDKKEIPYFYEILEHLKGKPLYSIWHVLSENERENVIKQLCHIMKDIHSNIGNSYDWCKKIKESFLLLYNRTKELNLFSETEQSLINKAYLNFDKYLYSKEFVLVHGDLHFDNIFYNNGNLKIIDFERSLYAPRDFELDIIYRMIRNPLKFASEEEEKKIKQDDYKNIMLYIEKYYKELVNIDNLYKRLAIYDIVYYLKQLLEYPNNKELKDNILEAANIIL